MRNKAATIGAKTKDIALTWQEKMAAVGAGERCPKVGQIIDGSSDNSRKQK